MKYQAFFIGLIFGFFSCERNDINDPKQYLYNDSNASNSFILKVDSICFYKSNYGAIEELSKLNPNNEVERKFIKTRLISLKSLVALDTVPISELSTLDTTQLESFLAWYDYYYEYKHKEIDIEKVKLKLRHEKYQYNKIRMINRIGKYYHHIAFDVDSMWHFYKMNEKTFESIPYMNTEAFFTYKEMSKICTYNRRHKDGIMYGNLLCDFKSYLNAPDSITKSMAYLSRSFHLLNIKEYKNALEDSDLALANCNEHHHSKEFQNIIRNRLYLIIYSENINKDSFWEDAIQRLDQHLALHPITFENFDRAKAQYMMYHKHNLDASKKYNKKAFEFEFDRAKIALQEFSSICFVMYQSYMREKDFVNAWKYLTLDIFKMVGKENVSNQSIKEQLKKMKTASFHALNLSNFYFSKYKVESNPKDLNLSFDYIMIADSVLFSHINSIEEVTILEFYRQYGNMCYELGMHINHDIYQRNGDKKNLSNFINLSEKRKNVLMQRDILAKHNSNDVPKVLVDQQKICKAELSKQLIIGARNNIRYNTAVQKLNIVESEIKIKYQKYFKDFLKLNYNHEEITSSNALKEDISYLSIDQFDTVIYYTHLQGKNIELYKHTLSGSDKIAMNEIFNVYLKTGNLSSNQKSKLQDLYFPEKLKAKLLQNIRLIPDGLFLKMPFDLISGLYKKVTYLPSLKLRESKPFVNKKFNDKQVAIFTFSSKETIISEKRSSLFELPGTILEGKKLKEQYPNALYFEGPKATKEAFIEVYNNAKIKYIHLALHGVSNSETKDDVKLYFRTKDFGIDSLYGYELLNYTSAATKIVLSACESGSGNIVPGEGVYSLARYFIIGGAESVGFSFRTLQDKTNKTNIKLYSYIL